MVWYFIGATTFLFLLPVYEFEDISWKCYWDVRLIEWDKQTNWQHDASSYWHEEHTFLLCFTDLCFSSMRKRLFNCSRSWINSPWREHDFWTWSNYNVPRKSRDEFCFRCWVQWWKVKPAAWWSEKFSLLCLRCRLQKNKHTENRREEVSVAHSAHLSKLRPRSDLVSTSVLRDPSDQLCTRLFTSEWLSWDHVITPHFLLYPINTTHISMNIWTTQLRWEIRAGVYRRSFSALLRVGSEKSDHYSQQAVSLA